MSIPLSLTVNGKAVTTTVDERTLLVDLLRTDLALTGTHVGCDTAQCGACTVLADGRAIKSCNVLAAQMAGARIQTIEGLAAADGTLHPMQAAFRECHGLQCGFCTPGFLMTVTAFLDEVQTASLDEEEIREAISGNLCRCTGYMHIVDSVRKAAETMYGTAKEA